MADYSRLKASLNNSRIAKENNALFQTVLGLIRGAEDFEKRTLEALSKIGIIESDIEEIVAGGITALTGDVVAVGPGSAIATIQPNAVTTPKIIDLAVTTPKINDLAVTTPKIAADSVTYAKMQNVSAASRLLGRGSAAGAGDIEELTLGSGLALTGTVLDTSSTDQDYVVASDGAVPPSPLNDGGSNFIYVAYSP